MICPTYHWFTKSYSKLVRTSTNIFFCHCSPLSTLHCLDNTSYCGFVVNHIHSPGVYACIGSNTLNTLSLQFPSSSSNLQEFLCIQKPGYFSKLWKSVQVQMLPHFANLISVLSEHCGKCWESFLSWLCTHNKTKFTLHIIFSTRTPTKFKMIYLLKYEKDWRDITLKGFTYLFRNCA